MPSIDLSAYSLKRPEKIRWTFPYKEGDVLEYIQSKSVQKLLKHSDKLLQEANITYTYKKLSEAEYIAWLPYYMEKTLENHYTPFAKPELYQEKMDIGEEIWGIFYYKHEIMIGSAIIIKASPKKAIMAYKASEKINLSNDKNSSLGAIIDYHFVKHMATEKIENINSGRSRNAFGAINTFGYLDYKLRFGYVPTPGDDLLLDSVPTTEDGIVCCFCYDHNNTWGLYTFKPKESSFSSALERFEHDSMPVITIEY